MKILVKYPSRQRADLFAHVLTQYIERCSDITNVHFLISLDEDDPQKDKYLRFLEGINVNFLTVIWGQSDSKIHACNRDLNKFEEWDIILLISDDMHVKFDGWDNVIRADFQKFHPDLDGCLWYHDGSIQKVISTLTCMGRKYFDRFGYIYYPAYKSFFCDNEYTDVAMSIGKMTFIDKVIIKHEHPANNARVKSDALYERNNGPWDHDKALYNERKKNNFR